MSKSVLISMYIAVSHHDGLVAHRVVYSSITPSRSYSGTLCNVYCIAVSHHQDGLVAHSVLYSSVTPSRTEH